MNIYNIFLPLSGHFYLLIVCVKVIVAPGHTQWTHTRKDSRGRGIVP